MAFSIRLTEEERALAESYANFIPCLWLSVQAGVFESDRG